VSADRNAGQPTGKKKNGLARDLRFLTLLGVDSMFTEECNVPFAPSPTPASGRAPCRTGFDHSSVASWGRHGEEPIRASVALARRMLEAASQLVAERYAWRGYMDPVNALSEDDRAITLIAQAGGATVVGTLTVRLDGPRGLRVDENYPEEVSALRAEGRKVCEFTQLALAAEADTKAVLSTLFGLAYCLGKTLQEVTDVLIEVNPRHVQFYRRLLGFVVAAGERLCERVQAPAVLLRASVDELEKRVLTYCSPDAVEQALVSARRLCQGRTPQLASESVAIAAVG
jgi:hypothetical protein